VGIADSQAWELHFSELSDCTLIVDAIFGTGLNAPVSGLIESVIADVNASGIPVVSIDLPSGLSADSPEPIGPSIDAGLTVTLGAPKLPLVLPPGGCAPATSSSPTSASRPKCSSRSTGRGSNC
jgi:NAD(P)H-hydrate epimerase